MTDDPDVVVLGQDVGRDGGVFRATLGLLDRFGSGRVVDTPLAENLIAGMSIGMMLISVELLLMLCILLFLPPEYAGSCFIGFAVGESLGAAALRIAGGIFTKIADIGSDLMKIVFKLPEDDPRNPGVIADCTGDNAGDSVGPSADGFETYGVTGFALSEKTQALAAVDEALRRGLRLIQVRGKNWPADDFAAYAQAIVTLAHAAGARVLINGDVELAQCCGADGVHLTSQQLQMLTSRPPLPLVGASCHSAEELRRAEAAGADFSVMGPVLPTPPMYMPGRLRTGSSPSRTVMSLAV